MRIAVVGAGVVGLSTAIRLAERGHEVRIVAKDRTPRTTSDVAAALYFPYRAAPADRVLAWARRTYDALGALAADPATGVTMMPIVEPVAIPGDEPWWAGMVPAYRRAEADELPPGDASGWTFEGPVIEMPRYLPWLEARAAELGVAFEQRALATLADAGPAEAIVNCSGLGARELVGDARVYAVRGQVAKLRNPGLARATLDETTPRALAYVIPRADGVVVGGTADERAEDLTPDPEVEKAILAKAVAMEPRFAGCEIIGRAIGLRPARDEVRLEAEVVGDGIRVVHNYGHGGSGVTLSWGCADEAADLAEKT